jgi:hypothetical protein
MDYEIVPDEFEEAEARRYRIVTWPVLAGAVLGLVVLVTAWLTPESARARNALFVSGAVLLGAALGVLGWRLIVHHVRKAGKAAVYISKRLGK